MAQFLANNRHAVDTNFRTTCQYPDLPALSLPLTFCLPVRVLLLGSTLAAYHHFLGDEPNLNSTSNRSTDPTPILNLANPYYLKGEADFDNSGDISLADLETLLAQKDRVAIRPPRVEMSSSEMQGSNSPPGTLRCKHETRAGSPFLVGSHHLQSSEGRLLRSTRSSAIAL
jgi:hypothetical protein